MDVGVTSELVLREAAGGVAWLTLNRPDRANALSRATLAALHAHVQAAAEDPAVRVVVVAAAGRIFCAGHDLHEIRAHDDADWQRALFDECSALMLKLQRIGTAGDRLRAGRRGGRRLPAGRQLRPRLRRRGRALRGQRHRPGPVLLHARRGAVARRGPAGGAGDAADRAAGRGGGGGAPRAGQRGGARRSPARHRAGGGGADRGQSCRPRSGWARRCSTGSPSWTPRPPTRWPAARWSTICVWIRPSPASTGFSRGDLAGLRAHDGQLQRRAEPARLRRRRVAVRGTAPGRWRRVLGVDRRHAEPPAVGRPDVDVAAGRGGRRRACSWRRVRRASSARSTR